MGEALKGLFGSKKFLAMLTGLVASLLAKIGFDMPADDILKIVSPLVGTYVLAQGAADFGKGAIQVKK